jgi:hypothetical protein
VHRLERAVQNLVGSPVRGRPDAHVTEPRDGDELVIETGAGEVALLLGHPFLQAAVRNDPELLQ